MTKCEREKLRAVLRQTITTARHLLSSTGDARRVTRDKTSRSKCGRKSDRPLHPGTAAYAPS